jgi:DNA-binding IclR family transcriptional regulator
MALAATSDDEAWFDSVAQREPGVASVSAAVWIGGKVAAAVGVSGPIERLTTSPGELHGRAVVVAAKAISEACRRH